MSSAVLGALEIQMMADLARFRRDMFDAKGIVSDAMTGIQSMVKNAMGGLVSALSVAAFGAWIKGAIDAADNMNDLSKSTGITVEKLSGLKLASVQSGTTLEGLAQGINKLSVNMGKDAEKFAKLGISAKDPIEAFKQLSDVFVSIKDPQLRAAFGAEALGKSWATAAPALAEGGEKLGKLIDRGESLALVTQDMAEQADLFNDQVEELKAVSGGAALDMAQSLLPTLNAIAGAFRDVGKDSQSSKKEAGFFTSVLKTALETVAVVALNVGYTFRTIGGELATWGRQIKAFATGEFAEGIKIGKEWTAESAAMRAEVDRQSDAILGVRTQTEEHSRATEENTARTVASSQAVVKFVGANKESAAAISKAATEKTRLTKAGEDYLLSLNEQLSGVRSEIDLGHSLSDSQKAVIKLDEQLREGKLLLTPAERDLAAVRLVEIEAMRAQVALGKDLDKIQTEAILKGLEDSASIAEQARRQREHNEAIGLTAAGMRTLESRRLDDALATAEQALQQAILKNISAEEMEGITLMVEELRGLKKAKEEGWAKDAGLEAAKAAKDAADEWKKMVDGVQAGLTDALMRAFENGKGFLDAFRSVLLNTFQVLILKPMVQAMVAQMSGGIQSAMGYVGSLFGGTGVPGASAAAPAAGTAAGAAGGAAGASMSNPAYGWAVLAAMQASQWHDQGFDAASARGVSGDVNRLLGGGLLGGLGGYAMGGWQADLSHGLSKLGLNEKWADILSSATGFSAIFGVGDAKTQSTGVTGQFGSTGFTGRQFADWKAEGGLLRSDKKGTEYSQIDQELAWQMSGAAKSLLAHVTEYASALALPVTALASVTSDARIVLGEDAAANEKAIADALQSYGQALVRNAAGGSWPFATSELGQFAEHGETALDTLNRLGGSLLGVNGIFETLGLSLVDASLAGGQAASELIALTGGLDAFATKTASYLAAYYTQGEQGGIGAKAILQTLSDAGIDASAFSQRSDLRALMDSLDPNVTGDRTQMAALLNVQAEFAKLTDYLAETGQTLGALAALAPQSPLLTRSIDPVEQSNTLLQTANDNLASIAAATQANTTELQALVAVQSAGTQSLIERLRDIADGLANAMRPGYLAELAQG